MGSLSKVAEYSEPVRPVQNRCEAVNVVTHKSIQCKLQKEDSGVAYSETAMNKKSRHQELVRHNTINVTVQQMVTACHIKKTSHSW
jgi:hypothetical protein